MEGGGRTTVVPLAVSYLNRHTPISATTTTLTTSPLDYLNPLRRQTFTPLELPLLQLCNNSQGQLPITGLSGGLNANGLFAGLLPRRPRGEKRPIPDEQKDAKYYEKRKRNNEAAKKSRDARKIREDRIAFQAAFLEQENSLLKAQVITLQNEMQSLRQIISHKENSN